MSVSIHLAALPSPGAYARAWANVKACDPAQPGPANALVKCANCTAPLNSREPLCGVCGFAPEKGQK